MNRRERGAAVLLTVFMSSLLAGFLLVLTKHDYSLSGSVQRDARDSDYDYDYWGSGETYPYNNTVTYPSPTPQPDSTCQALQQLASTTTGACSANSECNGVHCSVGVGTLDMIVEPCHNPPAIQLVGRDLSGNVVLNDTLTHSRREDIVGFGTLNVDIQQSSTEDSISVKVDAIFGGVTIPIIPQTRIPLNRDQCDFVPHTITPSHSTPSITPTPSPTPAADLTCAALEQIASSSLFCSTSQQCRGVSCNVPLIGSIDMTVEPCHQPPAVHIVGRDSSGNVVFNDTITESRNETIPGIATVQVNLEQSPNEDSITLSVDITPSLTGNKQNVIPETTIPLNRQQCGFTATPPMATSTHSTTVMVFLTTTPPIIQPSQPLISSSAPTEGSMTAPTESSMTSSIVVPPPVKPTKPSTGANSSTTIAVAVPMTIIMCTIGAIIFAVAIVMAVRRRRKLRREYQFQRMTFADDQDDNDDDGL